VCKYFVVRDVGVCALPFTQLFLNPDGRITPCCYLAQDPYYQVGDIQKQSLEEIWNGEPMRALRREHLSGSPRICGYQMGASRCHLIRKDLLDRAQLKEVVPYPMVRLDMMLNGRCNLECVMCGVWTLPNNVYTENGFWEQGREGIFPYLTEIDAKGGEPFIQKDIYRLIDAVSAVNRECSWHFTTNGHYRFTRKLRASVSKIRIVRLSVSIDSLDPVTFSKIRKKGELATVLRTLDDWIAYRKEIPQKLHQINANFVVQKANWHEVPAFYEFCRDKGIAPFFIILTDPKAYSALLMPASERVRALELYYTAMRRDRDPVYMRMIRPLLESLPELEAGKLAAVHASALSELASFGPSIAEIHA
jgi:cyclic pyranopterin phosphate synthase